MQKKSFVGSGLLALCLMAGFLACGCAPRERPPLTFDDQQALAANQQCRAEECRNRSPTKASKDLCPFAKYAKPGHENCYQPNVYSGSIGHIK